MEHEYHTSRRKDESRAWVPIIAAAGVLLLALGGVFLAFRDDGPAESDGPLPSLIDPTTTTVAPTVPPTTGSPVIASPVVAPTTSDDEPLGTIPVDSGPGDARTALRELADRERASTVSDIVPIGSSRFAMLVVGGDAELYRWTGDEWEREEVVDAPTSVSTIDTADVTNDGIADFVLQLVGLSDQGGVFSRATFSFGLLPFNTTSGQEDWVDGLHLDLGRLISEAVDNGGNRITVEWTWTGQQFEVLG